MLPAGTYFFSGYLHGLPELLLSPIAVMIGILCASACVHIAYKKGYNPGLFIALGYFLGLIGVIIAAFLRDKKAD